jgi:hypothetical protein
LRQGGILPTAPTPADGAMVAGRFGRQPARHLRRDSNHASPAPMTVDDRAKNPGG